jgi:hypothetical protein
MSYGRNPNYIYSDGDYMHFNSEIVSEHVLNAFLYKILLTNCREELIERLVEGKESWLHQQRLVNKHTGLRPSREDYRKPADLVFEDIPQDDPELLIEKHWMEECEDDIVKKLMSL